MIVFISILFHDIQKNNNIESRNLSFCGCKGTHNIQKNFMFWTGVLNNVINDLFFMNDNLTAAKHEDMLTNHLLPAILTIVGENFERTYGLNRTI